MRAKLLVAVCLAAMFTIASSPLLAHHGTAAFDTSNTVTLKGTMTDFQFINPHVQLFFDVKNDSGEVEHWQAELTAPNKLIRAGWTKHTLNPGDHVTVSGYIIKGGKHSLWIQKLIGPDGQSIPLFEQ
jgi:Family of unknown function (DUF6152)